MTEPFGWTLLDRYLAGETTADESAVVERWLNMDRLAEARERILLELDPAPVAEARVDNLVARVAAATSPQRARQHSQSPLRSMRGLSPRWQARHWMGVGAFGVAAILAAVWHRGSSAPSTETHEYAAATGQSVKISLPDGSRVTLAPQSYLVYGERNAQGREVRLDGEAFFEVVHRPGHPFTVRAGTASINVLGTSFSVTRYAVDSAAVVAVVDGKVAVQARGSADVIVTPGTTAWIGDSSVITARTQNDESIAAWRNGALVFDNVPIPAMLATLGRWYGYRFELADTSLKTRRVSVTYSTDKFRETMNILKGVLGVTLSIRGDTVYLHPQPQSSVDDGVARRTSRPARTSSVVIGQAYLPPEESGT